jgi:hypothetical protein
MCMSIELRPARARERAVRAWVPATRLFERNDLRRLVGWWLACAQELQRYNVRSYVYRHIKGDRP